MIRLRPSSLIILFLLLTAGCRDRSQTVQVPQPENLCTSAILINGNYPVYATNLDYLKDRSEGLIFVNKRNVIKSFPDRDSMSSHVGWISRFGSVTCNLIASQTPWAGMNETGLVVSLMRLNGSAAPVPDHRRWIWVQYWMQYVLDMCSSIDEVIAFDSTIRIVSDSRIPHYMITDHTGRCAVIEHINGKSVIYTGTSLPLKILANNPYKTSLDDWKDYTSQIPANRPISPSGTSSKSRFIRAGEAAAKFTPCDPDTAISRAFDLLFYASGQREKAPPPCWSLVFDSGRLRLYIKTILNRSTRYIDLGKLDFSCSSVVKMLDINSTMCGDISTALGNYDFTAHYSHALSAGRKWGLNMTPEFLEQRLRFFDSFQCRD